MTNKSGVALLLEAPELDISLYTGAPRIAAPYMKPLAHKLVNNAPADSTAAQKKQLTYIVAIAEHGDGVLDGRQSAVTTIRPTFVNFANAMGALCDSLVAKTRVPESMSDVGPRAEVVLELVFPDRTSFVKRDAHAAWSEGDRIIHFIVEHKLEKEIGQLVGSEMFAVAKQATSELGEALGVGSTRREVASTTDLQGTTTSFSRAVARYACMLGGDVDFGDAVSVQRFIDSVANPIDQFRSRRVVADATGDTTDATDATTKLVTSTGNVSAPVTVPANATTPDATNGK